MKNKTVKPNKAETPEIIKIDLACGDRKQEGFIGVDVAKTPSVDIVANILEFPWKFAKDNTVDELYTSHFVEHIPMIFWNKGNRLTVLPESDSVELFERFFEECWRILKVGAKMTIVVPYYSSLRCWQDPTHRRAISEISFLYLNKAWREMNLLSHCHGKSNFEIANYGYTLSPEIASRTKDYQVMAVRTQINSVNDLIITLTKLE